MKTKPFFSLMPIPIMVLLLVVACSATEVPAKSSPAPNISKEAPIASIVGPTSTPPPSDTPTPTATPSLTPTSTIAPTPTPQIGDIRVNPESGKDEVFNNAGEWVEVVPVWDGVLPFGVMAQNTEVQSHEDGSYSLNFTLEDGAAYRYQVTGIGVETLTNFVGEEVEIEFKPILPTTDKEGVKVIRYVDKAEGKTIAVMDQETNEWRHTYPEIATNLGQQELSDYMPDEVGFLGE